MEGWHAQAPPSQPTCLGAGSGAGQVWEGSHERGVNGSLVSWVGVKGQSLLGPPVGRGHPLPLEKPHS